MVATVLIIEVEGALRENLARRLPLEGLGILDVGGTHDLERLPDSSPIDVILLGLGGLGEKGLSLLKIARNRWPLVPVILLNSPGRLNLSIAAMKLGAFDELLIPFDMATLSKRIDQARVWKNKQTRTVAATQSEHDGGRNRLQGE
jgi:DNA-binding NtrC family response regulator